MTLTTKKIELYKSYDDIIYFIEYVDDGKIYYSRYDSSKQEGRRIDPKRFAERCTKLTDKETVKAVLKYGHLHKSN